jgi:hypothetical protein
MQFWKYRGVILTLQITIVLVILGGYLQAKSIQNAANLVTSWVPTVALFAGFVGAILVCISKVRSVILGKNTTTRLGDAWILIVLAIVTGVGVFRGIASPAYTWIFTNVGLMYESAYGCLECFFATFALWRVLKLKNTLSYFFVAGLFLTLLTATALGEKIWPGYPSAISILDNTINMATIRAMTISIALGVVANGLRAMFGIERSYVGGA